MGERLDAELMETARVLRWFSQYTVSNALVLFARWLRVHKIETLDDLERAVIAAERTPEPSTADEPTKGE